jgi:hypothetical protein
MDFKVKLGSIIEGDTLMKLQRKGFDFIFLTGFTGLTAPVKCGSAEIGSDPEQ